MTDDARSSHDQNDRQVETAVESILELGEVTMGVLGEIERMVGSGVRRFQIAQEGINRAKFLQLPQSVPLVTCACEWLQIL